MPNINFCFETSWLPFGHLEQIGNDSIFKPIARYRTLIHENGNSSKRHFAQKNLLEQISIEFSTALSIKCDSNQTHDKNIVFIRKKSTCNLIEMK